LPDSAVAGASRFFLKNHRCANASLPASGADPVHSVQAHVLCGSIVDCTGN
jgi:hypothetical protein